jgi:pyrophosphatase PpaX
VPPGEAPGRSRHHWRPDGHDDTLPGPMTLARPLAVLLDMDGTLLDTVPFILETVRHAFADRQRRPSDAEWIAGIGTPLSVQLAAFTTGPDDLEGVLARYRAYQREHHDRLTRPYAGAVEAIGALKRRGHPVAVVTGKFTETATRSLAHVGLAPFVDAVVGCDSCPRHKPDPEPVLLALERLGAVPSQAIFVGDSLIDVQAGNAAGVISVAATWGACTREALLAASPAHVLDDVAALPALVARLAGA